MPPDATGREGSPGVIYQKWIWERLWRTWSLSVTRVTLWIAGA